MCLLGSILAVRAFEDPDLIHHCGDAKALALGLPPGKDYDSGSEGHQHYAPAPAPVLKLESYSQPSGFGISGGHYNLLESAGHKSQSSHGYAVTAGLQNYGKVSEGIKYFSPPPVVHYSAPAPILTYAKPQPQPHYQITKLAPALTYSSHHSESNYASHNDHSSIKYVSAPTISYHQAPVYHQPAPKLILQEQKIAAPVYASYSSHSDYAAKENSASSYSSYSLPAIKTISQPIHTVSYAAPAVSVAPVASYSQYGHGAISSGHGAISSGHGSASSYSNINIASSHKAVPVHYSAPVTKVVAAAPVVKIVGAPAVASYVSAPVASHGYSSGDAHSSISYSSGAKIASPVAYHTVAQAAPATYTSYVTPVVKSSVKAIAKPVKIKHSEYYVSLPMPTLWAS